MFRSLKCSFSHSTIESRKSFSLSNSPIGSFYSVVNNICTYLLILFGLGIPSFHTANAGNIFFKTRAGIMTFDTLF